MNSQKAKKKNMSVTETTPTMPVTNRMRQW